MAKPRTGAEAAIASLDEPADPSSPHHAGHAGNGGDPAAPAPAPPRAAPLTFGRPAPALAPTDTFVHRHLGPRESEIGGMLEVLGAASLADLMHETVPAAIRLRTALTLDGLPGERELGEREVLAALHGLMGRNQVFRSYLGMGYHDCIVPGVIQRNILENPGWYTQYTPYQPEIAQGRLEALLNFQTMVADLTGLPVANASLLDEATAAAEAMHMCYELAPLAPASPAPAVSPASPPSPASKIGRERNVFLVSPDCHPQTLAVVRTRAEAIGITVRELPAGAPPPAATAAAKPAAGQPAAIDGEVFGVLVQYPASDGRVLDHAPLIERAHAAGALVVVATDLLALTLLRPPGRIGAGADIAVGSTQRFGVPLGYGGPHAAFLATREEFKRQLPGRIIGVSRDAHGRVAYRMALQTREQHIRREKATSNICTAQALLAIMAGMYAVYHGPDGLRAIARRVHGLAAALAEGLGRLGYALPAAPFFDTLRVELIGGPVTRAADLIAAAAARRINLRRLSDSAVGVALDETTGAADVEELLALFAGGGKGPAALAEHAALGSLPAPHAREGALLAHPVFNRYHTEHEMLRYIKRLESRDLSLTTSMIPLGSCTMKLNASAEMFPVSWPEVAALHPFAPREQTAGYSALFDTLERWLCEITGFAAASLQPNSGAQGELTGLLVIRAWHRSRGDEGRNVCLIPVSAHGTNPASAVMAGMRVVVVACDAAGNIELGDLAAKAEANRDRLAAIMVTYPSTHGVFEEGIRDLCEIVHRHGGQVYMDGANMNAQVGLCRPADIGADVCHLNLHKTFCIPHGGGGPGMGPICVARHLAPFLPGHPVIEPWPLPGGNAGNAGNVGDGANAGNAGRTTPDGAMTGGGTAGGGLATGSRAIGPVSAAPWGSAGILPISWVYIALMGARGLTRATEIAILNANYMAARLRPHFPVLYTGRRGRVAHEFIVDLRPFKASAGVEAEDVAKRLMDYGFHAPTQSFPVAGTLMIEPTESESRAELDRLCDALIAIRAEIRAIEEGRADRHDNVLKGAPHTARAVTAADWRHPYSREEAAFPAAWVREHKFWPSVGRIDHVWGDRNLFCTCPPVTDYE